ncbi:hypothetical protein PybrP1_008282 [[Pythium] brassicae (nom. inval.)]|nr:hypothetical protein PybrP1_008282 [[Pythium] brassicae (nom. inval.)]
MASPVAKKLRADDDGAMSSSTPPPTPSTPSKAHESTVLYSYWRSSCSWRVRLALAWKRVPYTVKPVHLLQSGGEHFLEQYTKLNPNQRLPTLVIDGHALSQSGAILEYLEETRPQQPLLPADPYRRALVRNVCGLIGSDTQPIQNLAVLTKVAEAAAAEDKAAAKTEWARYWIDRGFTALEQELALSAGTYCVGDDVTLADVYLVPQVYNAHRFSVDMRKFPTIARMLRRAHNSVHAEPSMPPLVAERTDGKPAGFFSRHRLSMMFRKPSLTSPRGADHRRSSAPAAPSPSQQASLPPRATVTAIDQEMWFARKKHAVATTKGVRAVNEDRFRVISSLERFGAGLLATEKKRVPSFDAALTQRVMESYVNNRNAPAYDVKRLSKASRHASDTELYGIYDGHGGAKCSSLLALLLPLYLLRQRDFASDIRSAAARAYTELNDEILSREAAGQCAGGSTAISLLVRNGVAYFCNTGDCRAVLVSRKGVAAMTVDHKASNEAEKQRIEDAGGMVLYVHGIPRVSGRLAVTRAFGDAEFKDQVIPVPEITSHALTPEDEYIVLASDGLWDALSNEQVLSCIRNNPWLDIHELARLLADRAIELGSVDNVTVVVADVRKRP